jgi:hypothetical protein
MAHALAFEVSVKEVSLLQMMSESSLMVRLACDVSGTLSVSIIRGGCEALNSTLCIVTLLPA